MEIPGKSKLLYVLTTVLMAACSHHPVYQVVRESSPLLLCQKIFASDLDAIEERNEILLQTGVIDTTDEQAPIKSAILHIDNQELVLTYDKSYGTNQETVEIYSGGGFHLVLTYEEIKKVGPHTIFQGHFVIWNKNFKSEFDIFGRDCNL
jgi:hypothetical protein